MDRRALRRKAILNAARAAFIEDGFALASMSSIAARLGGSKATLYGYFKSKEAMFAAFVEEECRLVVEDLFEGPDDGDLVARLTAIGERFLDHLLSEWAVRMFQVIVAEATRTPDLARTFYFAGPAKGVHRLAATLATAQARHEIIVEDCENAAEQFLALCRGRHHLETVLNLAARPNQAEIQAAIAEAVRTFMARYGRAEIDAWQTESNPSASATTA